ncbi:MAG: 7TM diverse intracellular signaling domain-containing protein [Pseudomonadota bacterium]
MRLRFDMFQLCLAFAASLLLLPFSAQAHVDLMPTGALYQDHAEAFPASLAAVPAWQAGLAPAAKVNLLGGSYWLVASMRQDRAGEAWVFAPNDTLIDHVEARLLGADGSAQRVTTGYRAPHEYMLHYGKDIVLRPGVDYKVLVRFSSPYYARMPVMAMDTDKEYRVLVARENLLTLGALGALVSLALINFFIYSFTRERSSLYYSVYVLTYALAWAMTFHVMADLWDWHWLELHYVPFFLLPVFSTLFYVHFLRLKQTFPRLEKISRINLVLPLVLLPSCFIALPYAHTLATIAISIWMTLALVSGIAVWRRGYQPARFFVIAFIALMVPGLLILPANLGLVPALVDNAQLLTLLGGTLDGILLAFALADQFRLLRNHLERAVEERTGELIRAKEHAEVVSRHRIDFLSAMSHDIRTPLAGVIGMLKFALRDRSVAGRTQEYLSIGLHNGEALLAILNDILDYSKIDAGKLTLESVSFRLADLVEDVVKILQGHADAKSLLLRCELGAGLPMYVQGDPTRVRQILINLLGNAIKFTEVGEVRLAVQAGVDGGLVFDVSDTGPGIAASVRERLFQKFEQADHSTTRRYGGTGLGLAICKELVRLMDGEIGVESREGMGSRFTVKLPLPAAGVPAHSAETKPRERHSHQLRILCAEDVRTNQIIIGTLLETMGHQVSMVENGLEALHALSTSDFDMVLMDGRMPLMDGEQATRLIRGGGNANSAVRDREIAVIALTANASEHDRQRYLAAGMNGFLSKPIDEWALFDQIDDIIATLLARGRRLRPAAPSEVELDLAAQFGVTEQVLGAAERPVQIVPLAGLSQRHMHRIAEAFLQEAPRRLDLVRQALEASDAQAAAAALHALKGSAGYLSSQELHTLSHKMELLASGEDLTQLAHLYPQLEEALRQAVDGLRPNLAA